MHWGKFPARIALIRVDRSPVPLGMRAGALAGHSVFNCKAQRDDKDLDESS
jgi:hypothetical protein